MSIKTCPLCATRVHVADPVTRVTLCPKCKVTLARPPTVVPPPRPPPVPPCLPPVPSVHVPAPVFVLPPLVVLGLSALFVLGVAVAIVWAWRAPPGLGVPRSDPMAAVTARAFAGAPVPRPPPAPVLDPGPDLATAGGLSDASGGSRGGSGSKPVHVGGYFRRDGTWVPAHDRALPGEGTGPPSRAGGHAGAHAGGHRGGGHRR